MGAYILISVLILIASVLLILVVLVQNSKGGGLASNFTGAGQHMGVRKTADFLEKSTWTLAIVMLTLSVVSIFVIPRDVEGVTTQERQEIENLKNQASDNQGTDFVPTPTREEQE